MRAALVVIGLTAVCPLFAQDRPAGDPLGPLREALEKTGGAGLAVTPREGAVVLTGQAAAGHATLVHEQRQGPFTLQLQVALEGAAAEAPDAPEANEEDAQAAEIPPKGAGLVVMTGPDQFVAFVLLPGGRTAVYEYDPTAGLQQRISTGQDFDSTKPHTLTLAFDGRQMRFDLDGTMAGSLGSPRTAAAAAGASVGLIVLGDATCVVRGYAVTGR